jgi:hypothetical protein
LVFVGHERVVQVVHGAPIMNNIILNMNFIKFIVGLKVYKLKIIWYVIETQ